MRGVFTIKAGAIVGRKNSDHAFIVKAWLDGETVVLENVTTGFSTNAKIYDLNAFDPKESKVGDLFDLTEQQRAMAKHRYRAIEPLLAQGSRKAVLKRSEELDASPATLYRWIKAYRESGAITSLVRSDRSDKGDKRLSEKQEILIKEAIDEYLSEGRPPVTEVYELLKVLCKREKVKTPNLSTFRNRIGEIEEVLKVKRRMGKKAAYDQFAPKTQAFPGANYPYEVIQIDHKRLDNVVVDEFNRLAVGRPWITVAIDVYSRAIVGYYLSLDDPNALSVGMCMAMTILPKEGLLSRLSICGTWPCFGIPVSIHLDNAAEFRSEALSFAAGEYGFNIAYRKVKQPQYGGHIESLLGATFSSGMSMVPGRTFSNVVERGEYNTDEKSALTLRELDVWILDFVANTYNQKKHSETLLPPVHRYVTGLLGSDDSAGGGRISLPRSGERLLLDFLPIIERPVHRSGIIIDRVWYYDEVLNRWINTVDPTNSKRKRKFIIRRDPRDISYVWFYDPEIKDYHRITYRNLAHPPMSLWEFRVVRSWMNEQGIAAVDEDAIFKSFERRRKLVKDSVTKTKKVRREIEKNSLRKNPLKSHQAISPKTDESRKIEDKITHEYTASEILPFDEIELY